MNNINRRHAMAVLALPALAIGDVSSTEKASAQLKFDLSRPEDNVDVYVKITGDLADRSKTYLQYEANVYFLDRLTVPRQIFKVKGIARKDQWRVAAHEYSERGYDHGLICNLESGLVIDEFRNPFTNEINRPIHYRSGPFEKTIGTRNTDGSPFILEWSVAADAIRQSQVSSGSRENWLSPEDWPKASTGETVQFLTESTYLADVSEVNDPNVTSASASHVWLFITPFPPWMLMGDSPGFLMWHWFARKIQRPESLDKYTVAEIEQRLPGYFSDERPWTGRVNGWTQYCEERRPMSGESPTCKRSTQQ